MPTSSNSTYPLRHPAPQAVRERNIEDAFLEKLRSLKYTVRPDINDRATLVQRMLSDDRSDKVIVTTIQKLGLALDENSKRNRQKEKQGRETFKQRLEPLRDKRFVFIFDECHRSQFGDNHKAIKAFFPRAQLFGFTGTPIFEQNASRVQIADEQATFITTDDIFQRELHHYTITHAIEDKNVLRFHVDYFRPEGTAPDAPPGSPSSPPRARETPAAYGPRSDKRAVIEVILNKHDAATHARRFNALLATCLSSLDDLIAAQSDKLEALKTHKKGLMQQLFPVPEEVGYELRSGIAS